MARAKTKKKKYVEEINKELIDSIPELEYDEETEMYSYATADIPNRVVYINFNELFERKDLGQHSIFRINDRKYYNEKILTLMINDMNEMFNNYINDYPRTLCNITMKIAIADAKLQNNDNSKQYSEEEFFEDINNLVENIKDDVYDYIERVYNPVIKEETKKKKVNIDLQVTEEMDKVYISSGIIMRLIIPLVNNYMTYNISTNNLIGRLFRSIMLYLNDGNDGAFTKIIKIIHSRVSNTKYIHKVMWDKLFNISSIDPEIKKLELFFKIIEGIIPKLNPSNSSIQFLDSVIKKQLGFSFTANFGTEHKCNYGDMSNDNDDNSDRMETIYVRNKAEDIYILNTVTIEQIINDFVKENEFTEEDFKEFDETVFNGRNVNKIQEYFLKCFFGYKFDLRIADKTQKKYLLYIMCSTLDEDGLTELEGMLLSALSKEPVKNTKNNSRIKYKNSKDYNMLMSRYQTVSEVIEKDNFVYKALAYTKYNYVDAVSNELIEFDEMKLEKDIILFFLSEITV